MLFNEIVIPTDLWGYGIVVCNADWSAVWWGSSWTTPYTMLAYYDADVTFDYSYYAEAIPWSLTTEYKWRCFKVTTEKATWNFISKKWAWTSFNNLGDETSVLALTYA